MSRVWLTESAIDAGAVTAAVRSEAAGATVLFVGTVRDRNEGVVVTGMRYEAYPAMAREVLAAIAAEAESCWPGCAVAAVHRTGELEVGDASIAVAVSAPHRAQAYDASRYVIESVKQRLPVWKKERYADGRETWLGGTSPPGVPGV